jgi:hypothetical protein
MSLRVRLLALLVLLAPMLSCGYVAVAGFFNPGPVNTTGLVTIVQFSSSNGSSALTVVTLVNAGMAQTLNFCGDQRTQFPVDQVVNAKYTPGTECNTLLAVTFP